MSDTVDNSAEQEVNEGVEVMSVKDAISFAQGIEREPKEAKVEEVAEDVVEETPIKEEVKDVDAENEEVKEEVVVEETPKPIETSKDPNEDLYDDEDREYFAFKKANKGATRSDFQESKVDYDSLDRKDLLRKSLRERYNLNESDEDLDYYISSELDISMDIDESEMSLSEKVALRNLTDDYINSKKEQQNKWAKSAPNENIAQKEQEEIVQLEDGTKMPKKKYDEIVAQRESYVKGNEEALNRVSATSFKLEVDDNGSKKVLEYSYEFSKEDKHRMLSKTSDVVADFNKTYTTKEGYNHEALNENKAWEDPQLRGKMLKSMLETARAEAIEEVMGDTGNVTLGSRKGLPKQETPGIKIVPLSEFYKN